MLAFASVAGLGAQRRVASVLRCAPRRQSTRMSAPGESVNAAIRDNRVMIFSKSYCPYCARAKFLLRDELQANPVIWELDEREDGEVLQNELLKLTGQRTVPNIFINQNHVGGWDDVSGLHATGKLVDMLD